MPLIHLIDASPYIFRAYFAVPSSITDASGAEANAVFGFAGFLLRYIDEEQPTHMAAAYDESLTTSFRNDFYPEYKAQRDLPPPELEAQQKACQEIARALGVATYVSQRYEADDLIGTLCHQMLEAGHDVVVVSSDKDLSQLVSERVTLYDFARSRRLDRAAVREKFGVEPEQVLDWQALAGDSVDNIPGVKGVGPKSAAALLGAFGTLEALYDDLDRVAELDVRGAKSLAKKLEAGRENAFLSKRLARIADDAPVEATVNDLEYRGAEAALVDPLFERMAFEGMRRRIKKWNGGEESDAAS